MFFRRKKKIGSYSASMVPPWIMFPIVPASSIGWSIDGDPQEYLSSFESWWTRLEDIQATAFLEVYPVPPSWTERYEAWEEKRKRFVPKA